MARLNEDSLQRIDPNQRFESYWPLPTVPHGADAWGSDALATPPCCVRVLAQAATVAGRLAVRL